MILITFPRSCVNLININRSFLKTKFFAACSPETIFPVFLWNGLNNRSCIGSLFPSIMLEDRFLHLMTILSSHQILVYISLFCIGTEDFPDASFITNHWNFTSFPISEITNQIHRLSIGAQTRKVKPSCSPLVSL